MVSQYPDAHIYFGKFRSIDHFAVLLEAPDTTVLQEGTCWMILKGPPPTLEAHWFCPEGIKGPAVRALVARAFSDPAVLLLHGKPEGPNRRAAGVLNRYLGAMNESGRYFLTRQMFRDYMARKASGA